MRTTATRRRFESCPRYQRKWPSEVPQGAIFMLRVNGSAKCLVLLIIGITVVPEEEGRRLLSSGAVVIL